MPYSDIDLQTLDLDIFLKDDSKLIHIASAGGNLPAVIKNNTVFNAKMAAQRNNCKELFTVKLNPDLDKIKNFKSADNKRYYLADFIFMARSGFYSYDKTMPGNFNDTQYHLVAWPDKKFTSEDYPVVFNDITLIEKTLPVGFTAFNLFDYFK